MFYYKKPIYIIQYNNAHDISISFGKLNNIDNNKIIYFANLRKNCKFSLIFNLSNNNLIGTHENISQLHNKGIFLKYIINKFINIYTRNQKVYNKLYVLIKVNKEDIDKKLYCFYNFEYKDNVGILDLKENFREINELNTELYINDKINKYDKYIKFDKEGEFIIKLKLYSNITNYNYLLIVYKNIEKINLISVSPKLKIIILKNININKFIEDKILLPDKLLSCEEGKFILNNYFKYFVCQTNLEIIKDMIFILYQIFNYNNEQDNGKDNLEKLIQLAKPYIINNININCIRLLEYIIEKNEFSYMIKTKSHKHLLKKTLIRILLLKENKDQNKKNEEYFYFYQNTTIMEILNFIKNNNKGIELKNCSYDIFNHKNIIEKEDYNKILGDLTKDKQKIIIIKKEKEKIKLFENGNLTEKFIIILKDLFKSNSGGKGYMTIDEIRKLFSKMVNKEIYTHDIRIVRLIYKFSSDMKTLKENEFFNIFLEKLKQDEKNKSEIVWKNLYNMGYNNNLEKSDISPILNNDKNMRYYLSNKINGKTTLLNELFEKNKETNDINLLNFILLLSTNIESYSNLLKIDFTKPENKFTSKPKNNICHIYNLIIIESIIEDLGLNYLNNEETYKLKICSEKYLPFDFEENIEKKKNFFINFIKYCYIDLIDYITILFKNLNANGIYKEEIEHKICSKGLKIINNIYGSFYGIDLRKSSENYLRIKFPNKLIIDNNLEEFVTNSDNYKKLIEQIILFINNNKQYLTEGNFNKFEISINKLIKICFHSLFI